MEDLEINSGFNYDLSFVVDDVLFATEEELDVYETNCIKEYNKYSNVRYNKLKIVPISLSLYKKDKLSIAIPINSKLTEKMRVPSLQLRKKY